jgi:phosphoribosylformylglycinamidine synthase
VCLAESCISQLVARNTPRLIGARIDLTTSGGERSADPVSKEGETPACTDVRLDALLFGETQSRVIISCKPVDVVKVVERAKLMGVSATRIGTVGGDKLGIKTAKGETSWDLPELHDLWWNSIARAMK